MHLLCCRSLSIVGAPFRMRPSASRFSSSSASSPVVGIRQRLRALGMVGKWEIQRSTFKDSAELARMCRRCPVLREDDLMEGSGAALNRPLTRRRDSAFPYIVHSVLTATRAPIRKGAAIRRWSAARRFTVSGAIRNLCQITRCYKGCRWVANKSGSLAILTQSAAPRWTNAN
jgi:hypothetical protein